MKITAGCRYDADTHMTLVKIQTRVFSLIRIGIIAALIISAAGYALVKTANGTFDGDALKATLMLTVVAVIYGGSELFKAFSLKRRVSGKDGIRLTDYTYLFESDKISVTAKADGESNSVTLGYNELTRMAETQRYFFLWRGGEFPFAIDKSTIKGGSESKLRGVLAACVGEKSFKRYRF